ncbi:MAG: triose-phosphate isomerase [Planctomycetes bacterium]|nr:triose-phosphate isomerase [Planctomycetota bacterium]
MRRLYVAGNWKMNLNLAEAKALVEGLKKGLAAEAQIDVAVCPPFYMLVALAELLKGTRIGLGAQNCHFEAKGAFTGEISPPMLKDAGCDTVIIGHSERRQYFGEAGELLKKKVVAALGAGLKVIYCIGETLTEREAGRTEAVISRHLREVCGPDVSLDHVTIAYEPVWAIGTGKTATPAQAQEAHACCRSEIAKIYNAAVAAAVPIQYGGSVKPDIARELMSQPDVDGALVGGASLKAANFLGIIEGALAARK